MRQYTIFLSHAYQDEVIAREYADELKARGYDVWLDAYDLQAGAHLSLEITHQLNERTALVVLLTPRSITSRNVEEECRYFISRLPDWPRKRFVPVHAISCDAHASLRLGLTPEKVIRDWDAGQYLYVDGRSIAVSEAVAKIIECLEQRYKETNCVDQPFRLDALTESQLACLLHDLFCRTYGTAALAQRFTAEAGKRTYMVDLITIRPDDYLGGERIIVEVKKSGPTGLIGPEAVHQVEMYLRVAGAQIGWLMTTGYFHDATRAAAAKSQAVKLFDRDDVVKQLRNHGLNFTADHV